MTVLKSEGQISVVIPTYNAAEHISDTVNSVLNQTIEASILVVDDGSTDKTAEILNGFHDAIHYTKIPNSGGPSKPRNIGITHSTTAYVSFFDADDVMHPEKLEISVRYLNEYSSAGLLCTDFKSIDPDGNCVNNSYLEEYNDFRKSLVPTNIPDLYVLPATEAYHHLLRVNFIGTSSVVCPRNIFSEIGGFDESMKNADDIDMWLRIANAGYDILFLDRTMHSYRVGLDSISTRGASRYPAMITGLEKQFTTLKKSEDIEFLSTRLSYLYTSYGWALRKSKDFFEAKNAYKKSLFYKKSFKAFQGLIFAWFRV